MKRIKRYLWGCLFGISFLAIYSTAVNVELGLAGLGEASIVSLFWTLVLFASGYQSGLFQSDYKKLDNK
ncbi:hypothetical protein ACLGL1_06850 [Peptococcus simiae]|uniref:hypothetical protein n=1 Tax=Peptococcus simiae TaxID=1643805 RepID=UPI00397FD7FD